MLIISHLELSLLELSILWANWWHWPHFTDKQIELRAVHSFAQGFVDMSSRAHSATSLCKTHSETQRECSLWVGRPGSHLRCPRAGVLASPSGSEALAGLPDSDIRGSPKSVLVLKRYDLRTRCFLLAVICFSIIHSALLPEPGLLGHSVRENKQICNRISTFSKHTEGRWEMHLIF